MELKMSMDKVRVFNNILDIRCGPICYLCRSQSKLILFIWRNLHHPAHFQSIIFCSSVQLQGCDRGAGLCWFRQSHRIFVRWAILLHVIWNEGLRPVLWWLIRFSSKNTANQSIWVNHCERVCKCEVQGLSLSGPWLGMGISLLWNLKSFIRRPRLRMGISGISLLWNLKLMLTMWGR